MITRPKIATILSGIYLSYNTVSHNSLPALLSGYQVSWIFIHFPPKKYVLINCYNIAFKFDVILTVHLR